MSSVHTEITVGELAATRPASIRVFEAHGIDYCCGGATPLADACRQRAIGVDALIGEIDRAEAAAGTGELKDWTKADVDELIGHIVNRHHAYMKTELPRLEFMLEKILAAHGANHGDVLNPLAEVFGAMKEELDSHLMKEERILFPLIHSLAEAKQTGRPAQAFHCGSVQNPLRVMLMEHDSAGDALSQLRSITGGYQAPADACTTFRAFYQGLAEMEGDLHQHIHLENNILFPRAVELES
jgi:regulator of cell morphogenesis and NO signaling